jgi:hypothetical protein
MLISYRRRFIFVHVVKTGGTSIRRALEPYVYRPRSCHWPRLLRKLGLRAHLPPAPPPGLERHPTATKIRRHLPQPVFSQFFKFAFVRNPWDQLVSKYFYILQKREHSMHDKVMSLDGFDEYVALRTRRPSARQKEFVADADGHPLVDFIGRFENLAADFQYICDRLRIKATLPHMNGSRHGDYRQYYTDRTAAMVEAAFHEEIEYFGFSFDGGVVDPAQRELLALGNPCRFTSTNHRRSACA